MHEQNENWFQRSCITTLYSLYSDTIEHRHSVRTTLFPFAVRPAGSLCFSAGSLQEQMLLWLFYLSALSLELKPSTATIHKLILQITPARGRLSRDTFPLSVAMFCCTLHDATREHKIKVQALLTEPGNERLFESRECCCCCCRCWELNKENFFLRPLQTAKCHER